MAITLNMKLRKAVSFMLISKTFIETNLLPVILVYYLNMNTLFSLYHQPWTSYLPFYTCCADGRAMTANSARNLNNPPSMSPNSHPTGKTREETVY